MLQKITDWLPGFLMSLLLFMAGVGPGEAASHLSEWASFLGVQNVPSWLSDKSADTWGIGIGLLGLAIWASIKWRNQLADLIKPTASPLKNKESRGKKARVTESHNPMLIYNFVLALVVVAVISLIGYEVYKSDKPVGGFIQMMKMGVAGPPLLTIGSRNYINVGYENKGISPVTGVIQITQIIFASSRSTPDLDTSTFNTSREYARLQKANMADREGVMLGPGQKIFTTVEVDFTEDDVKKLMEGTASLYLLGYAFWNEHHGEMTQCFRLQRPNYHPLKESDIVWHHCDIRKSNH